jgi:2',3'-cyclic-nucleotide 2'-phosphodiesterase (5'-nucleotidase family)
MGRSSCRIQAPARANGIAVADFVYDTGKKRIVSLKTGILSIDRCREHPAMKKQIAAVSGKTFRISRRTVAKVPVELGPLKKNEHSNALTRLYGQAIAEYTGAEIVFYGVNSSFSQPAGILNQFQLYRLLPYQDYPVLVHLSGSEIRSILEEQLAIQRKNGSYQAPFGLNFSSSKRKLKSLTLAASGQPVDPGRTYPTAFSSYIFSGSGRCPVLHSIVRSKQPRFFPLPVHRIVADHLGKKYPADQ